MKRSHSENLELDRKLAETARMLREFAIEIGEVKIAQHADLLERRANELAIHDQLRAEGFFGGGGYAAPGHGVGPLT